MHAPELDQLGAPQGHDEAVGPSLKRYRRSDIWGPFQIAPIFSSAAGHIGWGARYGRRRNARDASGTVCKKQLMMGTGDSVVASEECELMVRRWCAEGVLVGPGPRARTDHVHMNPRHLPVMSKGDMDAMLAALPQCAQGVAVALCCSHCLALLPAEVQSCTHR